MMTKLDHFLVMTNGTEPAPPAAECQKEFMMTIRGFFTSEALSKITVFKILANHM